MRRIHTSCKGSSELTNHDRQAQVHFAENFFQNLQTMEITWKRSFTSTRASVPCPAVRASRTVESGEQVAHRKYTRYCEAQIWLCSGVLYLGTVLLAHTPLTAIVSLVRATKECFGFSRSQALGLPPRPGFSTEWRSILLCYCCVLILKQKSRKPLDWQRRSGCIATTPFRSKSL